MLNYKKIWHEIKLTKWLIKFNLTLTIHRLQIFVSIQTWMKWIFTVLSCKILTEIGYSLVEMLHWRMFFLFSYGHKTVGPDCGDASANLSSTIFLFWLSLSLIWKRHLPPTPKTRLYFPLSSMHKKDANYQYFSQKKDFQKPENFEVMKSSDSATTNFCDELCTIFSYPSSSQLSNLSLLCSVSLLFISFKCS